MVRGLRRDDGAATVIAAVMAIAIVVAGVAVLMVGQALRVKQHAALAADLAALAGAANPAEPCRRAWDVAAANGARLVRCEDDGLDVAVVVAVPLPSMLARLAPGNQAEVLAESRAGAPESS